MKRIFLVTLGLAALFATQAQITKKVLIIGMDGCRSDALQLANTPNVDALIASGIYSPDALNDDITISGPGWSAILCGVWSDKHMVTNNDFSSNNYDDFPPIFTRVEAYNPELNTASICHWAPINDEIVDGSADYILNVTSDAELSSEAVDYITNNDPDCMFIHFDDIDHAGHSYGFSPEVAEYIESIEITDELIGPVIEAITMRPTYAQEDWLILLTPDHGGNGFSHGGTSLEEERIFFIASGQNVVPEIILADSEEIVDDPDNCLGDDIPELEFDGNDDYVHIADNELFNFGADQDFTIECRVRTSESADVAILGNKDWDSGFNPGFVFSFLYPAGPEWKVNIGDGDNRIDIETGGAIADNEWHTLSVSFDRDGLMSMFEDGVLVGSDDISGIGDINTGMGLFFGTDIDLDYDFDGSIAEVRVWNIALGSIELANWSCQTITDTHPNYVNLIGYWKLDEGTGATVAIDSSVNGNDGTINNAQWDVSDTDTVYDFSATPRLPDVPVTAMTHLCIPILPEWDLDGNSWVPACIPDNINNDERYAQMQVFPNPANNYFEITNSPGGMCFIQVYSSTGELVIEEQLKGGGMRIGTEELADGFYTIRLISESGSSKTNLIVSH
jgi:hypothetical protein